MTTVRQTPSMKTKKNGIKQELKRTLQHLQTLKHLSGYYQLYTNKFEMIKNS